MAALPLFPICKYAAAAAADTEHTVEFKDGATAQPVDLLVVSSHDNAILVYPRTGDRDADGDDLWSPVLVLGGTTQRIPYYDRDTARIPDRSKVYLFCAVAGETISYHVEGWVQNEVS
jgi:hypothetical protein